MKGAVRALTPEDAASFFPTLAIGRRINPYEYRCKKFGIASESNRGRSLGFTARRDRPLTSPRDFRRHDGASGGSRRMPCAPFPRLPGWPPRLPRPLPGRPQARRASGTPEAHRVLEDALEVVARH